MPIAINIDVNKPQTVGAPTITVAELREKVQAFVNSLYVNVSITRSEPEAVHHHSLSKLRGVCKSNISDNQAIEEYLSEKY